MRLDRYLRNKLGKIPQSLIEKKLRTGQITVNKKKSKSSLKIKINDKITLFNFYFKEKIIEKKIKFSPNNEIIKANEELIIDDNKDFIVLNKSAGISVQGGTKSKKNLVEIFSKSKIFKNTKPFSVHRLDKDTSGVFIIAKNRETAQLFTSFTSVDSIDGLTREIFFGSERAKRPELEADSSSSSRGRASTSTGNSSAEVIDEDKKTIKFLKDRLSSMEKAFELQESAVSADAGKGQDENFPYLQLLQLWRKKALESMTSSASAKSEILRLEGDLKSLRTEHGAKVREH